MSKFTVWTEDKEAVSVVHVRGTLDVGTALSLAQTMESLLVQEKTKIVLEVRQLWEMDVVGLQVLLSSQQQVREKGGDLRLADLSPFVATLTEKLQPEHTWSHYPSVEDAIQSYVPAKKAARMRVPLPMKKEIGLGDLIKRLTTALGIKPCGGCEQRAEKLNQMMVLGGKEGK